MVCGTKAKDGLTSLLQAFKERLSSSHRWLREAVVWTGSVPPPAWELTGSHGDVTGMDGDAEGCRGMPVAGHGAVFLPGELARAATP